MMRNGRVYWTRATSAARRAEAAGASAGYLEREPSSPARPTQAQHYTLDGAGPGRAEGVARRRPTRFPRIQNEAMVRLLGAEYADRGGLLGFNRSAQELDELDAAIARPRRRESEFRTEPTVLASTAAWRSESSRRTATGWTRSKPSCEGALCSLFRRNGASVDSRVGSVSLPAGGPVRSRMGFFSYLTGFGGRDMAVDLGTANTLVYVRGRGIVLSRAERGRDRLAHGRGPRRRDRGQAHARAAPRARSAPSGRSRTA